MGLLEGKKAVILGAASKDNIGQETARLFAAEGAEVVVAGRKEGPLTELAAEIGGHVGLCDITSHKEVHGLAKLAAVLDGRCTGRRKNDSDEIYLPGDELRGVLHGGLPLDRTGHV